ncbi:MAG: insulinase family protein [Clostridia bacterium]|nr:insulinase family protein [Clostridia bacterium]
MKIERMKSNKFKTNEIAIFLTMPLKKETITMNALLPAVLRRGTNKYPNQVEIGKQLENMYGAFFNCGIDKTGDNCILKFYIETVCDKFLPIDENLTQKAMDLINEIIFNPLTVDEGFCKEYVEQEKENLKKKIESRKDNKSLYSLNRCIEEMFENEPYGIYKYGNLIDLQEIDEKELFDYYKKMVNESEIYIVINGVDADKVEIPDSLDNHSVVNIKENEPLPKQEERIVNEKADVTQGKLIIGMSTPNDNRFAVSLYNAVLGGGANSKLFQNVREKASLAYSAGSKYIRRKDAIFIVTGIELQNYDKTLKIIKEQIEDIKNGKVTDDEFDKAKQLIISSLNLIKESQEDMIAFNYDQRLYGENLTVDEYIDKLNKVSKEKVIEVGKEISINTIYYLEK